jgi:hypothetical protein
MRVATAIARSRRGALVRFAAAIAIGGTAIARQIVSALLLCHQTYQGVKIIILQSTIAWPNVNNAHTAKDTVIFHCCLRTPVANRGCPTNDKRDLHSNC